MSDDEFDNIPDDFAGVEGVDWDQILAAPSQVSPTIDVPERTSSQPQSTESLELEEMDDEFLAELDVVEQRVFQEMQAGPSRLQTHGPSMPTHTIVVAQAVSSTPFPLLSSIPKAADYQIRELYHQ